ncbi:hypothetical protein R1sor_017447 [Riccia sorocarpa]|uniref:UBX domain-containing protein n=1 Tax=Riccia sorocarpa TaxID=122646 RepID=A0ABD3IAL9_9MARC
MADVLEAMGFPSDWCEKALSSSSGIETAVDLLLQWQAQGTPHLNSSSLGSGSPLTSSHPQGACSPSRPTLKLHPVPTSADSKGRGDEGKASPSSTLQPVCTSSGPSSSSGPSGVDETTTAIKSPVVMSPSPRDVTSGLPAMRGFVSPGTNGSSLPETSDRSTRTSISSAADARAASGRVAGSSRTAHNTDNSDAVVPDAFAEERRSRYAAAQRAKQEKEAQKAKIRQQLQEDKAQRRLRHTVMPPPDPSAMTTGKQPSGSPNMPVGVAANIDAPTHLQIRCPRSQVIKGSFTGGTSLKEVRAYVERELQGSPLFVVNREDSDRPVSVPFTGPSSRLSSDWEAERTLMQAARENFETQTSRIIASARTLRQTRTSTGAEEENQASGTMYFLIPIPRREFFTESAMESTLAEAQLVPSGTLIVQYRRCDPEVGNTSNEVQGSNIMLEQLDHEADNRFGRGRATQVGPNYTEAEQPGTVEQESPEPESRHELKGPSQPKKVSLSSEGGRNGASNSGRSSLEMGGERVRVRELALQAAARRMSEAARIFREGIPLGEGETGGAFPFPNDGDQYSFIVAPPQNAFTALQPSARAEPEELIPAGADAERVDASAHARDRSSGIPGSDRGRDRPLDALHRQAVDAAEARLRSSHCQPAVLVDSPFEQELKETESRVGLDGRDSPQSSRARVPPTSRLLSRPEKLQRRCDNPSNCNPVTGDGVTNAEEKTFGSGNPLAQSAGPSYAGPLEAALERLNYRAQADAKGKGPVVEEDEASRMATAPSSHQLPAERQIALRVRYEDGRVQTLSFPPDTLLQSVRDSVVPDGVDASTYGFFINVPEPHYVEGDDLQVSLEAAGLASREIVHLLKMSSRGMVRQGRRTQYRRRRYVAMDDDEYASAGVVQDFADPQERRDLTYEELMDLEESIGRVHVGVPEEMIAALPVHTVKSRKRDEVITGDNHEEDVDVCIICMAEMVDGEEALTLPCVHTFHPLYMEELTSFNKHIYLGQVFRFALNVS